MSSELQSRLLVNKEEIAHMYTLLGDIEKRIVALETVKQEKGKLRFSFTNPSAQQPSPSTTNDTPDGDGYTLTLQLQVNNTPTVSPQEIYVVGSIDELGAWDLARAVPLTTSPEAYPNWSASVEVPHYKGDPITLKFCKLANKSPDSVLWDNHEDYVLTQLQNQGNILKKVVEWNN